jgi:membrane associated rhomboid family serine protease
MTTRVMPRRFWFEWKTSVGVHVLRLVGALVVVPALVTYVLLWNQYWAVQQLLVSRQTPPQSNVHEWLLVQHHGSSATTRILLLDPPGGGGTSTDTTSTNTSSGGSTSAKSTALPPPTGVFVPQPPGSSSSLVYCRLQHTEFVGKQQGLEDALATARQLMLLRMPLVDREDNSTNDTTASCWTFRRNTKNEWCGHWHDEQWCRPTGSSSINGDDDDKPMLLGTYYYQKQEDGFVGGAAAAAAVVVQPFDHSFWTSNSGSFLGLFGSSSSSSSNKFRRHAPMKQQRNPRLTPLQQAVWIHPATTLWIGINVILAFIYWNQRVPVAAVAKNYRLMMMMTTTTPGRQQQQSSSYEIWRCLSGATAHFELWHLAVNCLSLSALGQQLENYSGTSSFVVLYTSTAFAFYNVTLMIWTSVIWLGLEWYRMTRRRPQQQRGDEEEQDSESSWTVGFSGVLFAWMVVAALEQQVSCPIFFLPEFCFSAFHIFGLLPFNWGPVVQLVVMQVVLPRVSWTGHLAGIIAGFALHWGLLPSMALQPAVAVPFLYYLYLHLIRRIHDPGAFVWPTSTTAATRWGALDAAEGGEDGPARSTVLHSLVGVRLLQSMPTLLPHGGVLLLSAFAFGPFSCLTISYFGVCLYAHLILRITSQGLLGDERIVIVKRGYIVATVVVIVVDAITLGGWVVLIRLESFHQGGLSLPVWKESLYTLIIMFFRTLVLLTTTVVAATELCHTGERSGIFFCMLNSTVLRPSETIGGRVGRIVPCLSYLGNNDAVSWNSAGPGRRLGGPLRES